MSPWRPRDLSPVWGDSPRVLAHRGGAGLALENTLAAFEGALRLGVGVELDLRLCASGELVVVHDADLRRLAGVDKAVAALDLKALQAIPLRQHGEPTDQQVPTFEQVLELLDGRVVVDVEVKAERGSDTKALVKALGAVLARRKGRDRLFFTSFSPFLLRHLRQALPQALRGLLVSDFQGESSLKPYEKRALRHMLLRPLALPDVLAMDQVLLNPARVRRWSRQGYAVMAWTVNDPQRMRALLDMGVWALITDRPDLALPLISPSP